MSERQPAGMSMAASGRGRWIGLAMLSVGVAMIIVDATIVNVAIPSIISDLDLDSTQAEWINTIYALVFAALLITVGRLGDVFGRRRMYLIGLVVFIAASVAAGLAPTGDILLLARVFQGIGGAMILPATQAILNTNFQGRDRAIAFGIWGSVIGGMAAVGPLLGGFLTTYLSWRWAFFINLPIGLLAIAGTLHYIGESKEAGARPGFDLPGFVLITSGLGLIVFGLIEGRHYGWWSPVPTHPFTTLGWTWPSDAISIIPALMAVGAVALVLFAIVETRRRRAGKFYLFDFTLWRYRGFRYGNLAGTIVSLGEFGLLFALPLFLQGVLGYSAFQTGLVFLSLAVGAFFSAPLAARFARRYGPRWVVTTGMILEAVGIVTTTLLISTTVTGFMLAVPLFVYGIGVGFATAQLTSIVLSDVPVERSGLASGANSTLRQVGSALGIAILGTVLFSVLVNGSAAGFEKVPPPPGVPPAVASQIGAFVSTALDASAGQVIGPLRDDPASVAALVDLPPEVEAFLGTPAAKEILAPYVTIAEQQFVDATRAAGFVATAFVILGVFFSLLLPATKPRGAIVAEASAAE
jgi:EmrB/QacA subfamily drug resistance transporter